MIKKSEWRKGLNKLTIFKRFVFTYGNGKSLFRISFFSKQKRLDFVDYFAISFFKMYVSFGGWKK